MPEQTPETPVKSIRMKVLAGLGMVVALAGSIAALNTFTGLSFRPAWGYETAQLTQANKALAATVAASDKQILKKIEGILKIQDAKARALTDLKRGQLGVKLELIERSKREARRELTSHQTRAEEYRRQGNTVPSWLQNSISDTQSQLREKDGEQRQIETRILELDR